MKVAALVPLLAMAALALPARAAASAFLAAAALEPTTPPLAGTADGRLADQQFGPSPALCAPTLYPDEGLFALQEPSGAGGYCDANLNGRRDQIYADNGNGPASGVHDPIEVRAFAISDGHDRPVVYASVDQIGLFDYYTEQARADLARTYHADADLVVSADHNESSPDSIGLYGAAQTALGVGLRSGIDEYYMRFLADRIARAAADAVHSLKAARLYAAQVEDRVPNGASGNEYPLLSGLSQRISDQFPTAVALPGDDRIAAVDTKLGVLQARDSSGRPIFTVMSLAAHNQEMGNSGAGISADWPGAFERAFDAAAGFGVSVFLVGDNGSEEDPQTSPPVISNGSENHSSQATQFLQVSATGARFAQLVAAAARAAQPLRPGPVRLTRRQFCVPLENNGFVALAALGEFGLRQGYVCDSQGNPVRPLPNGAVLPTASTQFRTFAGFTDVGPDLQLIDNPGEAFPALMLGSPFGAEEESCPRPNPAVPTWHARALYRFQVGLADDLIGYLIPPWGFASGVPGLFSGDGCYQDEHGHRHKLESESVGPTGAGEVADRLAQLLSAEPDPTAQVVQGRFVLPDGSYSRWPTGAVAAMIPGGSLIGAPGTAGFGSRAVDRTGVFMDYDGQPQRSPDLTTRGIMVLGADGCVQVRYYLDVFPALATAPPLGHLVREPAVRPVRACRQPGQLQPLAAAGAGLAVARADARLARRAGPFAVHRPRLACRGRLRRPRIVALAHKHRFRVIPGRCGAHRARIARVTATRGSAPRLLRRRALIVARGPLTIRALDTDGMTATRVIR